MITIAIDENTKEGRALIEFLRNKTYARIVDKQKEYPTIASESTVAYNSSITNKEELHHIPFKRIPGFAYTNEERIGELREAMKEFDQGTPGIPHEEVMTEMIARAKKWR